MTEKSPETREITVERLISAAPDKVFDAWLDPKIPGSPFSENDKIIIDARVDGLWYWLVRDHAHYGRFTDVGRPERLQHTWMSRKTAGVETVVTMTFQKKGDGTLMTLRHSGFITAEMVDAHDKGWNFLFSNVAAIFGDGVTRVKDMQK